MACLVLGTTPRAALLRAGVGVRNNLIRQFTRSRAVAVHRYSVSQSSKRAHIYTMQLAAAIAAFRHYICTPEGLTHTKRLIGSVAGTLVMVTSILSALSSVVNPFAMVRHIWNAIFGFLMIITQWPKEHPVCGKCAPGKRINRVFGFLESAIGRCFFFIFVGTVMPEDGNALSFVAAGFACFLGVAECALGRHETKVIASAAARQGKGGGAGSLAAADGSAAGRSEGGGAAAPWWKRATAETEGSSAGGHDVEAGSGSGDVPSWASAARSEQHEEAASGERAAAGGGGGGKERKRLPKSAGGTSMAAQQHLEKRLSVAPAAATKPPGRPPPPPQPGLSTWPPPDESEEARAVWPPPGGDWDEDDEGGHAGLAAASV